MQWLTERKTVVALRRQYNDRMIVFISCFVALLFIIITRITRNWLSSSSSSTSWVKIVLELIHGLRRRPSSMLLMDDKTHKTNNNNNNKNNNSNDDDSEGKEIKSNDKNNNKKVDSNVNGEASKSEKRNSAQKHVVVHVVDDNENKHRSHEGRRHRSSAGSRSSHHRKVDTLLPNMIILVGIHCCGKSYWAEEYISRVHKSYKLVSSDAIRKEIIGSVSDYSRESEVEEEMLKQIRQLVEKKKSFIIDDCQHNLNIQFRLKLLEIAPEGKYNRVINFFPFAIFSARKRLENDLADKVDRYNASELELEELAKKFAEIESEYKEEGWIKYDIMNLR